jgi:hypothetical protein
MKVCSQPMMCPGGHHQGQNGWSASEHNDRLEAAGAISVRSEDKEFVHPLEVEGE